MGEKEQDDLYYCSALDKTKGCRLGKNKHYDCSIWPLRIMRFQGKRVITFSTLCPAIQKVPLEKLKSLAKELSTDIFAHADKEPYMVKDYIDGYFILATEE